MEFVKLVGPTAIFFIMYSLGLKLTFINFYELLKSPKNLIAGLICPINFSSYNWFINCQLLSNA